MLFQQSEATAAYRRMLVYLVDDTDGKTPETGVTPAAAEMTISKNGGTNTTSAGVWGSIGLGEYYYEFTADELNTVGFVSFNLTKTGIRTFVKEVQVVPWDPNDATKLGLSLATKTELATEIWLTANQPRWTVKKNTLFDLVFDLLDADGVGVTGLTGITGMISQDGGVWVTLANELSITEIGRGAYKITITAAEANYNFLKLEFAHVSAKTARFYIPTQS